MGRSMRPTARRTALDPPQKFWPRISPPGKSPGPVFGGSAPSFVGTFSFVPPDPSAVPSSSNGPFDAPDCSPNGSRPSSEVLAADLPSGEVAGSRVRRLGPIVRGDFFVRAPRPERGALVVEWAVRCARLLAERL